MGATDWQKKISKANVGRIRGENVKVESRPSSFARLFFVIILPPRRELEATHLFAFPDY
jgi:hypothetical protein